MAGHRATRRALAWALGSVLAAVLTLCLALLLGDAVTYDGRCPGSPLPFVGEQASRTCGFGEYFAGHGLFTLRVLAQMLWPIVALFLVLCAAFGVARDRQGDGPPRSGRPGT